MRPVRQHCRKIVREYIGGFVFGIFRTTSAFVARAKITLWVVGGSLAAGCSLLPALPRTLCAMRGDKDPVSCQRIIPSVGTLILVHDCGLFADLVVVIKTRFFPN